MDTATAHVLQRLDTIIDRQAEIRDLIKALPISREPMAMEPCSQESTKAKINLFSRLQKLPLHWQWITGGVVSWGVSAAIGSYLKHGGDPVKLIETLLAFFVSAVS